jgi:hypothetical protein
MPGMPFFWEGRHDQPNQLKRLQLARMNFLICGSNPLRRTNHNQGQ